MALKIGLILTLVTICCLPLWIVAPGVGFPAFVLFGLAACAALSLS